MTISLPKTISKAAHKKNNMGISWYKCKKNLAKSNMKSGTEDYYFQLLF